MNTSTRLYKKCLSLLFTVTLLAAFAPLQVLAQQTISISSEEDMDADIVSRIAPQDATASVTTRAESVDLLLANDMIVLQFTDEYLQMMSDEIEESEDLKEASMLGEMFRSMISSGVRSLLDHGLAIPLYEIDKMYFDENRLVILNREGEEIFDDLEINDVQVMEDFERWDALSFISEVENRMK